MTIFYKFLARNKIYFFAAALFFSGVFSASAEDLKKLSDHRVIFDVQPHQSDYHLALSSLKKVNNDWISEREKKVSGSISRKTIEFTGSLAPADAWQEITSIFSSSSKQILFECSGLDCGSSNTWANNRFEIKQLYGLDASQFYRVLESVQNGRVSYDVLYLVQRGNRRVYAQLDKVVVADSAAEVLLTYDAVVNTIKNKGFVTIPSTYKKHMLIYSDEVIRLFVQVLNDYPEWHIALVGHSSLGLGEGVIKNNAGGVDTSKYYAQYFLAELEKTQNYKKRLVHVAGIGQLAPRDYFSDERVELVLLK